VLKVFGSFGEFKEIVPNKTLCADDEIIRVGFMAPNDVKKFVATLEAKGLCYLEEDSSVDMVVIDQMRGPTTPCDWIEFGHVELSGNRIAVARLAGSQLKQVITPPEWKFEGSLSQTFALVPAGAEDKSLRFLRHERGPNVYLNLLTGREVYMGRTAGDGGRTS
jgi:hypothetical protein